MKEIHGIKIHDDVSKMGMVEISLNMAYMKNKRAQYRDFGKDMDAADLIKIISEHHGQNLDQYDNEEIDELMSEWSCYGENEINGQIALLYWSICGMAVYRELTKELIEDKEKLQEKAELYDAIESVYEYANDQDVPIEIMLFKKDGEWIVCNEDGKTAKLLDWYKEQQKEGK